MAMMINVTGFYRVPKGDSRKPVASLTKAAAMLPSAKGALRTAKGFRRKATAFCIKALAFIQKAQANHLKVTAFIRKVTANDRKAPAFIRKVSAFHHPRLRSRPASEQFPLPPASLKYINYRQDAQNSFRGCLIKAHSPEVSEGNQASSYCHKHIF